MSQYITTPADYWIASNAITITLNALGDANRIQGSVASGAVIMCLVKEVTEGDGLGYGADHNPKRWPLSLSPTYFNSDTEKYVYVAIPRSTSIGTQAVVVFPSEKLDIYGRSLTTPSDSSSSSSGDDDFVGAQIGSPDYFYVYLQAVIDVPTGDPLARHWKNDKQPAYGELDTAEGIENKINSGEWYDYNSALQLVTFLKEIVMGDNSKFRNLKALVAAIEQSLTLGTGATQGELTGVATNNNYGSIPEDSDSHIVTPSYLDEFGNTRYLSKVHDDTAAGIIAFLQGLKLGDLNSQYGFSGGGAGNLLSLIFNEVIKSAGASKGFEDGKGIYIDGEQGLVETDGLNVRGFMRVMELIINRLQLMESDYSFTEGGEVEHIDYEQNGQVLVLTMKKSHDKDYTPFYPGDIIYAKVNDLLPRDGSVPDGHTVTKNGSYYTSWMKVKSVDYSKNQLRVELYAGKKQDGTIQVPGGINFSPYGTALADIDITDEMLAEYNTMVEQSVISSLSSSSSSSGSDEMETVLYQLGMTGYDTMLNVTRHGNVADGIDPATGQQSASVLQSQKGRQQSWHLSTTDQRIVYYWNVDEPIVAEQNIALCLGMLPQTLADVVPTTVDWSKPSLYVSQIYYETASKVKYPARILKTDRGEWTQPASSVYTPDAGGEWTPDNSFADKQGCPWPDGTIPSPANPRYGALAQSFADYALQTGQTKFTVSQNDIIPEPYHFKTFTFVSWLFERLAAGHPTAWADAKIEAMMFCEWKTNLEISRVWHGGKLWECLVDGTVQEPLFGCTDWQPVGGDTAFLLRMTGPSSETYDGSVILSAGETARNIVARVTWGTEDVSAHVLSWRWDMIEADGTIYQGISHGQIYTFDVANLPVSWNTEGYIILRCVAQGEGFASVNTIRVENVDIVSYSVDFTEYVDVITIDDTGNVIGGLWTAPAAVPDGSTPGESARSYRITSAINVRRNGTLLTVVQPSSSSSSSSSSSVPDGFPVGKGKYAIYFYPVGCQCFIEDSTIYITAIDNIKDGVSGTSDDTNFDYDAMRAMDSCRVDLVIDCEGRQSITKTFPITIKHSSEPFVGADITNEHSGVSWNTKTQRYIGLPITFDFKMWHNNEPLDIATASLASATDGVSLIDVSSPSSSSSSANVSGASPSGSSSYETPLQSSTIHYTKTIVDVTKDGKTFKIARIQLVAMSPDIPLITDIDVTCTAVYAGVSYERTLRHTITKTTDTNVYSLLPSVDEIITSASGLSADNITCIVVCDSSDNKHYNLACGELAVHKLAIYYKKAYNDGHEDAEETLYTETSSSSSGASSSSSDANVIGVSVDQFVAQVKFYLYGLTNGIVDRTILHDCESVPVISRGADGNGYEHVFFLRDTWDGTDADKPTIYDASGDTTIVSGTTTRADLYQHDNYCPYEAGESSGNPDEYYGDQDHQWTDEPQQASSNHPYEFYAQRKKVGGVWQPFGDVILWNQFATSGESPYAIDLSNERSYVNCEEDGTPISGAIYETSKLILFKGLVYAFSDFKGADGHITVTPTNISCNGSTLPFTLTDSQLDAAQSAGYFLLMPSDITSDAATVAVEAVKGALTLSVSYKINKNIAGKSGLIYSLITLPDVMRMGYDTSIFVFVKRTVGTSTVILDSAEAIASEGLTLAYTNVSGTVTTVVTGNNSNSSSSSDSDGQGVEISVVDFVGTGTWGKLVLTKGGHVTDTERIGMVSDGIDGQGSEEVFIRTNTPSAPIILDDSNYTDSHGKNYLSDGHLPCVIFSSSSSSSSSSDEDIEMNGGNVYPECTTNPKGICEEWPYEWTAKRTKSAPQSTGKRQWNVYSGQMVLHGNWTDKAKSIQYSLVISPNEVHFHTNAVGDYVDKSVVVTATAQKTDGDVVTESDSGPYRVYLRIKYLTNASGESVEGYSAWTNAKDSISVTITTSQATRQNRRVGGVEFAISDNTPTLSGSVVVARSVVNVTLDGTRGVRGLTGRMFFSLGYYDHNTVYQRTGERVPLVFFDDGEVNDDDSRGSYYYLPESYETNVDGENNHYAPAQTDKRTGTVYSHYGRWTRAQNYGVVITQGLFAEFAKLGKAVMCGNYMFSMNGRIEGLEYSNTEWKRVKAYTLFGGDPSVSAIEIVGEKVIDTSFTELGMLELPYGATYYFRIRTNNANQVDTQFKAEGDVSYDNVDICYYTNTYGWVAESHTTATVDVYIRITPTETGLWKIRARKESGSGSVGFTVSRILFRPNWWVDLLSGKMNAAQDNFVVEGNGDVLVMGTIKATNLYRAIALSSGNQNLYGGNNNDQPLCAETVTLGADGKWVTWIYFRENLTQNGITFLAGKYYTDKEIDAANAIAEYNEFDWKNEPDICSVCTGPADEVFLTDTYATDPGTYKGIVLIPRCEDFAGKTITIRHTISSGNNTADIRQCDFEQGKFVHGALLNGWQYNPSATAEYRVQVEKGQNVVLYSTGTVWMTVSVTS